ncbi:hypothetical protein GE09DRAFT_1236557 [Coniochaeta sp. 2T2.1]|nr:hypothetical protein GE09DRAFT_1236557 [Coniochaeta sp. 2T2.1]
MDIDSDASSEASVFDQEPISGAVLLDQGLLHRETCISRGNVFTGCAELDEDVLVGGLERGRVVGLSAEEEGFGLLLGLQTIARLLVSAGTDSGAKAMIITTLSHAELLPTLRSVVKGQVGALHGEDAGNVRLRVALERISISRVFDFDGLREALDELDFPSGTGQDAAVSFRQPDAEEEPVSSPEAQEEAEIRDSEDDEPSSSGSSSLSDPPPSPSEQASPPPQQQQQQQQQQPVFPPLQQDRQSTVPDIVLTTNLTTLITSLYTTRDRKHAHRMLRHLTSKLRYLSRSPSHGGPLFILLNSTTSKLGGSKRPYSLDQQQQQDIPPSPIPSSPLSHLSDSPPHSPLDQLFPQQLQDHDPFAPLPQYRTEDSSDTEKEDDLAPVRSLFNPPPPPPQEREGEVDEYGYARHPNPEFEALARLSRRNKPFFGLRFDALVELHLLATKVPRMEEGAEVYLGGLKGDGEGEVDRRVETVWVVEVLGDRRGVWVEVGDEDEDEEDDGDRGGGYDGGMKGEGEWDEEMEGEKQTGRRMGRRFYREQRWAGVEVLQEGGGTRIIDAG